MGYRVKELHYTLQGEGAQSGRAAVFVRFSGCNLWSGREADRASAVCRFCDTDFLGTDGPGGGEFPSADSLAAAARAAIPEKLRSPPPDPAGERPLAVFTGGEPALQLDSEVVRAFHAVGFEIAVETNGTRPLPPGIDWITLSPKAGADPVVRRGDELKLVFPQTGAEPERYEAFDFPRFVLQPMDGPNLPANTAAAARYCMEHPRWRLGLQAHKIAGLR